MRLDNISIDNSSNIFYQLIARLRNDQCRSVAIALVFRYPFRPIIFERRCGVFKMAVSVGSGLWIILTLAVVLFYFLVFDVFPKVELLARLFLIGKLREKGSRSKIFNLFDVPKR